MRTLSYGIQEIASWLLDEGSEVHLPAIQRGFVWKTYQIENLWDSIFREYPIGSFLFSEKDNKKELFDGQQRATSIALGFYNPWEQHGGKERIGNDKSLPVIWVDLDPKEKTDNGYGSIIMDGSVHSFRVVTKSHPWGYCSKNNTDKMPISDRTDCWEQLKSFGASSYTKLKPSQRAPYSAHIPVPLCFLFEAAANCPNAHSFADTVKENCLNPNFISEAFCPYYLKKEGKTYREGIEGITDDCWDQWWKILRGTLDKQFYSIPAIVLDDEIMNRSKDDSSEADPTLFVRLNSGGTNLQGEELIYSIYKACYPNGQNLVEGVASETGNLIAPSRVITLAAKLAIASKEDQYLKSLTSRSFQAKLSSDNGFRDEMDKLVREMKPLVSKAISILRMRGDGVDKSRFIPDVVVKTFIKESPEGMFLLLNYLRTKPEVDPILEKTICRKLYRNYWFGYLDRIVPKFWKEAKSVEFWRENDIYSERLLQIPLINPARLEEFLLSRVIPFQSSDHSLKQDDNQTSDIWSFFQSRVPQGVDEDIPSVWLTFLWRLLSSHTNRNKSFILLAQREYIQREFSDFNQLEDLQDTNTPWDWDHIFPRSWGRSGGPLIKEWLDRIGNFRAMPLVDNRHESNDLSPAKRFSPSMSSCSSEQDDGFLRLLHDYCVIPERDLPYWKRLNTWCSNAKGNRQFEIDFSSAIIMRSINIYQEFYDLFEIND